MPKKRKTGKGGGTVASRFLNGPNAGPTRKKKPRTDTKNMRNNPATGGVNFKRKSKKGW